MLGWVTKMCLLACCKVGLWSCYLTAEGRAAMRYIKASSRCYTFTHGPRGMVPPDTSPEALQELWAAKQVFQRYWPKDKLITRPP